MEKITRVKAIKRFFEREDSITPNGGRKVEMDELKTVNLSVEARNELATLAAAEMGMELETSNPI